MVTPSLWFPACRPVRAEWESTATSRLLTHARCWDRCGSQQQLWFPWREWGWLPTTPSLPREPALPQSAGSHSPLAPHRAGDLDQHPWTWGSASPGVWNHTWVDQIMAASDRCEIDLVFSNDFYFKCRIDSQGRGERNKQKGKKNTEENIKLVHCNLSYLTDVA